MCIGLIIRVVASTQSFKYQYKYQYLSLKYQYQYQYPCLKLQVAYKCVKYKYQYFSSKYQYQYKYLKMVLKYRSSTSTSTQYYSPANYDDNDGGDNNNNFIIVMVSITWSTDTLRRTIVFLLMRNLHCGRDETRRFGWAVWIGHYPMCYFLSVMTRI